MKPQGTLLLTRDYVGALLTIEECIATVELWQSRSPNYGQTTFYLWK